MNANLGKNTKITVASAYDLGSSAVEGAVIDMSGWDGVVCIVTLGAITSGAATSVKWQQNIIDSASGMADLLGTGVTIADSDDDELVIMDLYKPLERYVRVYISKATQNAATSAIYIRYRGSKAPIDNSVTGESTYELHISPAEGTA
jgi:hypothetical protein